MYKYLTLIGLALLTACGESENASNAEGENAPEVTLSYYGDTITEDGALTAVEFLTQFEGKDSMDVKLKATITEVCQKKGCWMVLDLGEDKSMRVRFKDYGFFMPKDADSLEVVIEGQAKMSVTTVAMLKHYAKDAGDSQEVIDAITEDELNYNFEAFGVILKGYEK